MAGLGQLKMRWENVSIIGAGLLGGSLGLAIRRRHLAAQVRALVRREPALEECRKMGVADVVTMHLREAVEGADLVILCTPLLQMAGLAAQMRPYLKAGAIVTDVGSVKGPVVRELEPLAREAGAEFIGSHPMAGSEKIGVSAAREDLFLDAVCLVTPSRTSPAAAVARVEEFWTSIGGVPMILTPEAHDDLVSRSSHLPHVLAAELANYVLSPAHPREQAMVCANGFRDTTRIASGSPEMWRDIALANRQNLARVLGVVIEDLKEVQWALEREDAKAIEEFFAKAKQRRDGWTGSSAASASE
jgi:prephenate dehydrogenase